MESAAKLRDRELNLGPLRDKQKCKPLCPRLRVQRRRCRQRRRHQLCIALVSARGPMDKASAYGAWDCRLESRWGHGHSPLSTAATRLLHSEVDQGRLYPPRRTPVDPRICDPLPRARAEKGRTCDTVGFLSLSLSLHPPLSRSLSLSLALSSSSSPSPSPPPSMAGRWAPCSMTAAGFEPKPFRAGALSRRLRLLGQTVLIVVGVACACSVSVSVSISVVVSVSVSLCVSVSVSVAVSVSVCLCLAHPRSYADLNRDRWTRSPER